MATRGKTKAGKVPEDIEEVSGVLGVLSPDEREQKAQQEIDRIEAEIREAALEAMVAELRRVKEKSGLKKLTCECSSDGTEVRSSLDECTLPAPSMCPGGREGGGAQRVLEFQPAMGQVMRANTVMNTQPEPQQLKSSHAQ